MNMAVYERESQFRELLQALRQNNTLRYLDISKASLPGDANEETCETLKMMFAENQTLEELDISGEHAHLEVAKFGIGLNHALTGLAKNETLKILRIECELLPTLASALPTLTLSQIKSWAFKGPTRSRACWKRTRVYARSTAKTTTSICKG